jgi:hypothetical protein
VTETAARAERERFGPGDEGPSAAALIARHVQEDPNGRSRHRSYVVVDDDTSAPIWVLAGYLRHGASAAQAAADYALPHEAVTAAFLYYARHHDVFDAWLLLNEQGFEGGS